MRLFVETVACHPLARIVQTALELPGLLTGLDGRCQEFQKRFCQPFSFPEDPLFVVPGEKFPIVKSYGLTLCLHASFQGGFRADTVQSLFEIRDIRTDRLRVQADVCTVGEQNTVCVRAGWFQLATQRSKCRAEARTARFDVAVRPELVDQFFP